MTTARGTK